MNIKRIIRGGLRFLTSSDYRFEFIASKGGYKDMPDEEYLKRLYKLKLNRELNLENPRSYNEKLQWIKIYDRNPLYTIASDKYEARDYVKEKIGEEHLIPLYGSWTDADDIDFDKLPDEFVLKCNHNSGLGMCICKNKSELNIEKARKKLKKGLEQDYFFYAREWQYKNIKRRIIAEKLLKDDINGELLNYKVYCFGGKAKMISVQSNEGDKVTGVSFLDLDWNVMPFHRTDYPIVKHIPEEVDTKEELLALSEKLSEDFPFMRVDLYYVDGNYYFSELTLDPCGGFSPFTPAEWDYKIGEWLELPQQKREV